MYDVVLESDFKFLLWEVLCLWGRRWLWWSLSLYNRFSWTIREKPCLQYSSLWAGIILWPASVFTS